jgi:hypothetical protein
MVQRPASDEAVCPTRKANRGFPDGPGGRVLPERLVRRIEGPGLARPHESAGTMDILRPDTRALSAPRQPGLLLAPHRILRGSIREDVVIEALRGECKEDCPGD